MEKKQQDRDLQFVLWFIASILLHLLVIILFLFWYFETSLQRHLYKKHQPITPRPLLAQAKPDTSAQKTPILWKDLKKPEPKENLQYTLIPGRQAVTESQPTQPKKESTDQTKSISSAINNQEEKITQTPAQPQPKEHSQEAAQKDLNQQAKKQLSRPSIVQEKPQQEMVQPPAKTHQERLDDIKEKLLKEAKLHAEQKIQEAKDQILIAKSQETEKSNTTNPTIVKNKITLKDLQLGFSKFMQEGNNDILLQKGNTNQSPDAQALRIITYQQQLARTIVEAIHAHHQHHLVSHIQGLRPQFTITVYRSGKLKDVMIISSSKNELFDKIVKEAIENVNLYPALPQHITGETFSQTWILMH